MSKFPLPDQRQGGRGAGSEIAVAAIGCGDGMGAGAQCDREHRPSAAVEGAGAERGGAVLEGDRAGRVPPVTVAVKVTGVPKVAGLSPNLRCVVTNIQSKRVITIDLIGVGAGADVAAIRQTQPESHASLD